MTSNNASTLPPELTRSGRLDTTWYFGMPMQTERREIFKIHLDKTNIPYDKSLIDFCAEETPNFTGAEIKEVCKVAVRKAFNRYLNDGVKELTQQDIKAAIKEIVPVYNSNKEQLASLENYYSTRARWSNNKPEDAQELGSIKENFEQYGETEDEYDFLN